MRVSALVDARGTDFGGAFATDFGAGFAFGFTTVFGDGFAFAIGLGAGLALAFTTGLTFAAAPFAPTFALMLPAFAFGFAFAVTNFNSPETTQSSFCGHCKKRQKHKNASVYLNRCVNSTQFFQFSFWVVLGRQWIR